MGAFLICMTATIFLMVVLGLFLALLVFLYEKSCFSPLFIKVMDKEKLSEFLMSPHESVVIINILDYNDFVAEPIISPKDKMYSFFFDDVDSRSPTAMTDADARKIVEVVQSADPKSPLIVKCEAGTCRSAAIAAAISKVCNGEDDFIFAKSCFKPNMYCYYKMLKAFNYDEPAEDKDRNREAEENWKKYNGFS